MSALVIGVVLDGGREEGVDEGGLAQARLASNLTIQVGVLVTQKQTELETSCCSHAVYAFVNGKIEGQSRTMMVKPAPRLATILCRWLGRLAMPIGEALSAAAGAILQCGGATDWVSWARMEGRNQREGGGRR